MLIPGILSYDPISYTRRCWVEFRSLVGTGNLDRAAIFNTQGTSVWASSPGFTVRRLALLSLSTYPKHACKALVISWRILTWGEIWHWSSWLTIRLGLAGGDKRGHCFVLRHFRSQEDSERWFSNCRWEIYDDQGGWKECIRQESMIQSLIRNNSGKYELTLK